MSNNLIDLTTYETTNITEELLRQICLVLGVRQVSIDQTPITVEYSVVDLLMLCKQKLQPAATQGNCDEYIALGYVQKALETLGRS